MSKKLKKFLNDAEKTESNPEQNDTQVNNE